MTPVAVLPAESMNTAEQLKKAGQSSQAAGSGPLPLEPPAAGSGPLSLEPPVFQAAADAPAAPSSQPDALVQQPVAPPPQMGRNSEAQEPEGEPGQAAQDALSHEQQQQQGLRSQP